LRYYVYLINARIVDNLNQ